MKIKNILFIGSYTLLILIVSSSCQKVLKNDYYMGMDSNDQFSTPDRIELAAVGLYDGLQNAEFLGGRALIYVDIRSDDVDITNFFGQMSVFNPLSSDATVSNAWLGGYETVFACNFFIQNLNAHADVLSEEATNGYLAEARFIRGLVYFYMLNFWGQQYCVTNEGLGIPLVMEAADASSAFQQLPARSTIAACYDTIVADLQYAEEFLPATRADAYSTLARANKAAARAMLSRVYLYMGDNANAITYANKVINKDDGTQAYSLDPNLADGVFLTDNPSSSPEPIFFIAMSPNDNPNTNNALGQHYGYNLRGDISVSTAYVNSMDITLDKRYIDLIRIDNGSFWTKKYEVPVNSSWVPVIRYAEVLLNKAEATAKTNLGGGVDATALGDLNSIRRRSGLADTTINTTNQDLLGAVLLERYRELAFEGHASFDAFRNQQGVPVRGIQPAQSYPNDKFALPIPQSDIQKNPNLKQNATY